MPLVTVEDHGAIEAEVDEILLELCERYEIPMDSACGGFACCNSCRVEVLDGGDNLSALMDEETPFLDEPGQRLGCQARVRGAVSIRLAPGM